MSNYEDGERKNALEEGRSVTGVGIHYEEEKKTPSILTSPESLYQKWRKRRKKKEEQDQN